MNVKTCLIVFASTLGLIVIAAVVGNVLESAGVLTRATLGPRGIATVKAFYLVLFGVLGFAVVPLVIKYFVEMQIRIGNGALGPIQWLQDHERGVIYGLWGMIVVGLGLALPAAMRSGFFK
jgi:hypothetical protein